MNVQTYTTAFTTSPITNANATAVSFSIAKAPTGTSWAIAGVTNTSAANFFASSAAYSTSNRQALERSQGRYFGIPVP